MESMYKHFVELKEKHPDAILLFRTGDFYETYCEDAKEVSKILGIALTESKKVKGEKGKPLAMAGFPHYALDSNIPKLLRAGKRVIICEPLEKPQAPVKRGIADLMSQK